jgi:N-acetylated-alpha-linked acidic dipeptidase
MRPALLFALLIALIVGPTLRPREVPAPFGFGQTNAKRQARIERRFLRMPSPTEIRDTHRFLTAEPHLAGSRRDRELARYVQDRFTASGLDEVSISTHEVLLPWPLETSVEMVAPRTWRASMREEPVAGDIVTEASRDELGPPYHAYSASGEVTAPVVYAGGGHPEDYDRLSRMGIDVRGAIVLVRYSVPYSYRGFKALTAQQRGAAGILIYSDPADDGEGKGRVYPHGPWGPASRIQRGGIAYDFLVPGDPLTPGWASLPGAPRVSPERAVSLPAIISAPLSSADARVLLDAMGGPEAPSAWRGGLATTYRVGGGPLTVRLRVQTDNRIRPVWTVTGMLRGAEHPNQLVIVGNHRDAWTYGGVDPSSGTAAMMELARTLGALARGGWRPRRSILFASWDAEEFALTSSTEWVEEHAAMLQQNAVAYINVDSAASGQHFTAAAVPSLNRLLSDVAEAVKDPRARIPVAAAFRDRLSSGTRPEDSGRELVSNRLGSGSDYTAFLNFVGVPVADLSFRGPYGVYHSIYDNHDWVARIGDPGFRYHVALVQLWGLLSLRLANADVLPLDYEPYARRILEFVQEVASSWTTPDDLREVTAAAHELQDAATMIARERQRALGTGDGAAASSVDTRLMRAERALLHPEGLPGRPWYRHMIFAPKFTYEPEVLPALAEAIRSGNRARVRAAAQQLAGALVRAAAILRGSPDSLQPRRSPAGLTNQ